MKYEYKQMYHKRLAHCSNAKKGEKSESYKII